jgi:hypothetical protein
MKDRIDSEGAVQTAYEQLAHLQRMLDSARVEHQNNPRALNLETVQIRRLMEDIQAEIDYYLQRPQVTVPPATEPVQP